MHRCALFYFSRGNHHIIVDIRDRQRQSAFLEALQQTNMKSPDRLHYVMATFGIRLAEISKFERGFLNFTSMDLVKRNANYFWRFADAYAQYTRKQKSTIEQEVTVSYFIAKRLNLNAIQTEIALLYDALAVAKAALLDTQQTRKFPCTAKEIKTNYR